MKVPIAIAAAAFSAVALTLGGEPPRNFQRDRLVAWCIVPFDAKKRGPEERAKMLGRLGMRRCAYDWRAEHVPSFEAEILAYQRHGIEFTAFWGEHEAAFGLFEKYGLKPQIWKTCPSPKAGDQGGKVAAAVTQLLPLARRCASMGSWLGLYNHGGWGGQPENLVAVCKGLRAEGCAEVGIVYNFHHAHDRIGNFADDFDKLKPYLLCLNLNGMNAGGTPKILTIGEGEHEREMIDAVISAGYNGPIGVLDHLHERDSAEVLQQNMAGLARLLAPGESKPGQPSKSR